MASCAPDSRCQFNEDVVSFNYLQNLVGPELFTVLIDGICYCFLTENLYYFVYDTYILPEEKGRDQLLVRNKSNPYTNIPFDQQVFRRLTQTMRELKSTRRVGAEQSKELIYEMNGYQFSEEELLDTQKEMEEDDEYLDTMEILLEDMPDQLNKTKAMIEYIEKYM